VRLKGLERSEILDAYRKVVTIISNQDTTDKEKQRQVDEVIRNH
jgi:predicted transcriptional regulator